MPREVDRNVRADRMREINDGHMRVPGRDGDDDISGTHTNASTGQVSKHNPQPVQCAAVTTAERSSA
jgi:hypothetical protein